MACNNAILLSSGLGQIGAMFPYVVKNVSGAMSEKDAAERFNVPFANCSSEKGKTVVLVRMSENGESFISIDEKNSNCYLLNLGECKDNILIGERFLLEIVSQLNEGN